MKNQVKLAYEAPSMKVLTVELEQGIAAASATFSSPQVDDFGSGTGRSGWSDDESGF